MRLIWAALLGPTFVAAQAYNGHAQEHAPKLDNLEIMVRPGVSDFDFKVGHLWDCFEKSSGRGRVIKRTGSEVREIVRVEAAGGELLDFHFRLTDTAALLDRITDPHGAGIQDWNEIQQFVAHAGACK